MDTANERVQVFSRDGRLRQTVSLVEYGWIGIAYGSDGRLLVMVTYRGYSRFGILAVAADGTEELFEIGYINQNGTIAEMVVDGSTIWGRATGTSTYEKLMEEYSPTGSEERVASRIAGYPGGDYEYRIAWPYSVNVYLDGEMQVMVRLRDFDEWYPPEVRSLRIPAELPLDEIRAVGTDSEGSFYAMVRIWESGWTGTESWYHFGVSSDGTCLGSVMVSIESYAGAGWNVTPDGKMIEVFTTEDGVGIVEYELQ